MIRRENQKEKVPISHCNRTYEETEAGTEMEKKQLRKHRTTRHVVVDSYQTLNELIRTQKMFHFFFQFLQFSLSNNHQ